MLLSSSVASGTSLTSLSLISLIYKMGIILIVLSKGYCEYLDT